MGRLGQSCKTKGMGWMGHKIPIIPRIITSSKIGVEVNINCESVDDSYQKEIHRSDSHE